MGTGGSNNVSISVATGGMWTSAGDTRSGGAQGTGGMGTKPARCNSQVPTNVSGALTIAAGYVTVGTFKGYGFTWRSELSNNATCITPDCDSTGCSPAFGATSLCAAGVVAADSTYETMVGIGFNLNQSSSGDAPYTNNVGAGIIVSVLSGSSSGDRAARVQLIDSADTTYCVEAGRWSSGRVIPITDFNTNCWDGLGSSLKPGTGIVSVHIVVPSDATQDRPFELCLTNLETFMLN